MGKGTTPVCRVEDQVKKTGKPFASIAGESLVKIKIKIKDPVCKAGQGLITSPLNSKPTSKEDLGKFAHGLVTSTPNTGSKATPNEDGIVQGLRQNMREELVKRLSKSNLANSKQSPEMQTAFAKRLEELLFKTAKSVKAYSDSETLDRRLQALMTAMQKRKSRVSESHAAIATARQQQPQQKKPPQTSGRSTLEQRKRDVLLRLLGHAKMVRVFKVIAEIKLLQLGREVTAGKPYAPIPVCTKMGCSFSVPCPGDQKVPDVVRDLFFNTPMVAAFEKASVESLATLPWDQLLAQGEARLAAYHEWYGERQGAKKTSDTFRTI